MPKSINTPRHQLICGKLDLLIVAIKENRIADALDLVDCIRYDAERMEAKLIIRKQEAEQRLNPQLASNSAPEEYDPLEDSDDPRTMNLNNG